MQQQEKKKGWKLLLQEEAGNLPGTQAASDGARILDTPAQNPGRARQTDRQTNGEDWTETD